MNLGGWIMMIVSVSFVTLLLAWCLYKVMTAPPRSDHLHAQTNIDPHDREV